MNQLLNSDLAVSYLIFIKFPIPGSSAKLFFSVRNMQTVIPTYISASTTFSRILMAEQNMAIVCDIFLSLASAGAFQNDLQYNTHTISIINVTIISPIILSFSF
eukprot:TRINITY_DN1854_c0_g6_i1.p2 TRINITY_DN1854_c0_g6~~TRINITY_DN1854_c0_g6_i1.p2  ORF type:complete len:104 (-),score=3.94 TRINITY_DN1854_c0_g6_i1:252-563(-)